MARIKKLSVKNYRGIKDISIEFGDEDIICFIGRGDSGKSTILDAISSVLSSSWSLIFYDTDFYDCDYDASIEIEASIIDFPEKLLSDDKYGLYARSLNLQTQEISDEIILDDLGDINPVLTIKLIVDKSLEPKWTVVNAREQEERLISAADRATINCSMISDHIDRHFSWSKGNPLFSLLKGQDSQEAASQINVVIDSLRQAKLKIDDYPFSELMGVTTLIKNQAAVFGLNISEAHTTLDFKELSIKDGRISLHENAIPFRLKGKGSKRIASFAIQTALIKNGGIMLIDEIEQGLEPDRIKQIIRVLKEQKTSQIFLTTHSREVVTELNASSLFLILKENNGSRVEVRNLDSDNDRLQKSVRACPEAFFAKKVIVCEGATEIGICRAIEKWRNSKGKEQMSFKDCAYVDGTGNTLVERSKEIKLAGINTALLCDSDDVSLNMKKNSLKDLGINIFDCELGKCIEQQVFTDIPWGGVIELLMYVNLNFKDSFSDAFKESSVAPIEEWAEDFDLRCKIVSIFNINENGKSGKKWFKSIQYGEKLGEISFKYVDEMDENCHLRKTLFALSGWIDS